MKIKNYLLILIWLILSSPLFANNDKPIACKNFDTDEIRQIIKVLDKQFEWTGPGCKIVGTKSIFPKKDTNGAIQFEKGLQLFVYQENQLKFICLPGWLCKFW